MVKLWQKLLIAPLTTVMVLSVVFTARAQQTPGQGLEISPPLIELNVDPGQSTSFPVRVRNVTDAAIIAKGSVDDFVAAGEDGQPKLLLEENAEPSPYSFKPWVQSIPDINLAAKEAKTTEVSIQVPQNASPGGHYGVIRFSAVAPELEDQGVALSASVGTLVLINVSGELVNKASLTEIYTAQNGQKRSFFETGPITFVERIRNEGNVHFKPIGTLRITNMFGKEVKVLSVNEPGGNVLPQSTRRFEQELSSKRLFGRYKVEANIQYNGQNLESTMSFWVVPYKTVTLVIGVGILLFMVLRTGIKRYNSHIIKKASKSKK